MARTRVSLISAGILTGALVVLGIVLALWSIAFGFLNFGGSIAEFFTAGMFWSLLTAFLHYAAFGVGVFVSLRFAAPVTDANSWRRVVRSGVIATIFGAVSAFIYGAIVSAIAAVTIGAYPFGYSLDAAVDPSRIQYGLQNVVAGALTPLLAWLPLTVLACVFLKLWLSAHPMIIDQTNAAARDRVAVSAKP
jgi:hypothetical protein